MQGAAAEGRLWQDRHKGGDVMKTDTQKAQLVLGNQLWKTGKERNKRTKHCLGRRKEARNEKKKGNLIALTASGKKKSEKKPQGRPWWLKIKKRGATGGTRDRGVG